MATDEHSYQVSAKDELPFSANTLTEGGRAGVTDRHILYDAFISYSHAVDGKLAPTLQTALQRYGKPWYRQRQIRVFRDQTNLSVSPELWPRIEHALAVSRYFVLLASPAAAASDWVRREVEFWLQNKGPETLLLVVTEGQLSWSDQLGGFDWDRTDALPREMANAFRQEPLWVDMSFVRHPTTQLTLRNPRFAQAVLMLSATIQNRSMDEIGGEAVRQHRRNLLWARSAVAGLLLLFAATSGAAVLAYRYALDAEAGRKLAAERLEDAQRRDTLRLAAQSREQTAAGNAVSGMLLALEALPDSRADPSRPLLPDAVGSLLEAMYAQRERVVIGGHEGAVLAVDWAPDGTRLVTAAADGVVSRRW